MVLTNILKACPPSFDGLYMKLANDFCRGNEKKSNYI
jgi:hypothetical protein